MKGENLLYLACLHKIWINQKKLFEIFKENNNYKKFFLNIWVKNLEKYLFTQKQIDYILENKNKINIWKIKEKLKERKVQIITINNKKYPNLLSQIFNPPYFFYLRWKIDNKPKISVVWTRKISLYWKKIIEKIIPELSNFFDIVSWWAAWCDSYAHEICLKSWNNTICVIWTWIDIDYPVWNKKLFDKIIEKWWWIISIFPIWEVWNPYNFPIRNEIVAWISLWTLIIEWKMKSWTSITANLALEMWKDLFAVPWDIFKINSFWCNNLIKNWNAKLISQVDDILEEYNLKIKNKKIIKPIFSNKIEEKIYNIILIENLTIDELIKKTWINLWDLILNLTNMEIKNMAKKTIWWKYEII